MDLTEKTVAEHLVFDGRILKVYNDDVALSDGTPCRREIVRHPGGAAVLLVLDGKALLVRQYRYAYGEELWEIPAGKIERGTTEDPAVCAARELAEETGYLAASMISLGILYPSPGYTDERLRLYLCTDAEKGEAHPDDGEQLCLEWFDLTALAKAIRDNKIRDAKTVAAVLSYFTFYDEHGSARNVK